VARSYPYLSAIKDPAIAGALRVLFDQIAAIKTGSQAQQGNLDVGGNRVRRIAAPVDDDDAVPLGYVTQQLKSLKEEIRRRGAENLTGQLAEPQVPKIVNIPVGQPLPDKTITLPGTMVRQGAGNLFFFNPDINDWESV
jgi:hypothetical protein